MSKQPLELPAVEEQHVEEAKKQPWITPTSLSIVVAIWIAMLILLIPIVLPVNVNVEIGQPSSQDVISPRRIEDRYNTDLKRQEARDAIKDIRAIDASVRMDMEVSVNVFFDRVEQIHIQASDEDTRYANILEAVPKDWMLNEYTMQGLTKMSITQGEAMREALVQILNIRYRDAINDEADVSITLNAAIDDLLRVMSTFEFYDTAKDILSQLIRVNCFFDEASTALAREEAAEAVIPIMVQQGESIIRNGSIVTEREYALIKDLGMLETSPNWDIILAYSSGLLGLLILMVFVFYLLEPTFLLESNKVMVIGLLIVITLALGRVVTYWNSSVMVMIPVPAATLIAAILFGLPIAMAFSVVLSIIASFLVISEVIALPLFLVGSMAALFGSRNLRQRTDLLFNGFRIGSVQVAVLLFDAALHTTINLEVLRYVSWGLLSGLIAGFLTLGLLPFLEGAFNLISALKLLELGNPNHRLLRRLMMEAPGSYQHSIMVANLAEIVCDEIGADSLLSRVGAYFHDVGKLRRPVYFVENQLQKENPHDQLRPNVSAAILFAHVSDGLDLAKEYQLPEQIQQFIRSHHGTSEAAYFYRRAMNEAGEGVTVNPEDYRYPGPKPPNREVAVVMLADSCEAAVRTLAEPSEENIARVVQGICRDRLNNGQLDESDLTIRDLTQIIGALTRTLTSVYHHRIQYPPLTRVDEPTTKASLPEEEESSAPEPVAAVETPAEGEEDKTQTQPESSVPVDGATLEASTRDAIASETLEGREESVVSSTEDKPATLAPRQKHRRTR